jgi:hypothetical protein
MTCDTKASSLHGPTSQTPSHNFWPLNRAGVPLPTCCRYNKANIKGRGAPSYGGPLVCDIMVKGASFKSSSKDEVPSRGSLVCNILNIIVEGAFF